MLRNVASQKWRVYAWDATTGLPKTGDAANISARIQIDDAASAATNDAAPTEVSSTNQKGYYDFDLLQAETDGAKLSLSPSSSTANIVVVACPPVAYTRPNRFSNMVIDAAGLVDANAVKGGPSGSGVALSAALIANLKTIYDTDYPTVYDTTNKAFLSKLGNFAMGGSSLNLTLGTFGCSTFTASGAVAFQSTVAVTGAFTATNASNDVTGVTASALGAQAKLDVNAECDTALADAKAAYAVAIEAAILNEGDATALLAAISAKVEEFLINEGDSTATMAAIAAAVWSAGTRVLTAGTNIVLAKGTGVTGFNDLSAAQVNTEVDTALADYDGPTNAEMVARTLPTASYATAAALATVDGIVDDILLDTAEIGAAGVGLSAIPKTGYILASTGLDPVLVAGVSVPTALKRIGAAVSGESDGAGTDEETYNDWAGNLCMTVIADEDGNRTNITFA